MRLPSQLALSLLLLGSVISLKCGTVKNGRTDVWLNQQEEAGVMGRLCDVGTGWGHRVERLLHGNQ